MPINIQEHGPGTLVRCLDSFGDAHAGDVGVVTAWHALWNDIVGTTATNSGEPLWYDNHYEAVACDHPVYSAEHAPSCPLDPELHGPGTLIQFAGCEVDGLVRTVTGWRNTDTVVYRIGDVGIQNPRDMFVTAGAAHPPAPSPEPAPTGNEPEAEEEEEGEHYTCADCNASEEGEAGHTNGDGEPLCESCAEHYHGCESCGRVIHEDESHFDEVGERSLCESCYDEVYFSCDDCGRQVHRDNGHDSPGGNTVCERCYGDNYFYCEGCNETYSTESYGDDGMCQGCCDDDGGAHIRPYSDRTANRLGPFGKGPLFFGVELEVEAVRGERGALAETVLERIGNSFAICKEDGSLSNGFEIVTAPADLATHRAHWGCTLNQPIRGLRSWNTSTCGMHVHCSRKALSQLTIGKLLVFVNADENEAFIRAVAGRGSNTYSKMSPKRILDAKYPAYDRYQAINLQNENTIEFRIFKGTLLLSSVLKNIEFCAALIEYCQQAGLNDLHYMAFLRYVQRTPKVWPNLSAWLRGRGYIRAPKVRHNGLRDRVPSSEQLNALEV